MRLFILLSLITLQAKAAQFIYSGIKHDITEITSAGANTAVTKSTNQILVVTGTQTQSIQLPDATTIRAGYWYTIANESSGNVIIKNNSGTTLRTLTVNEGVTYYARSTSSVAGSWSSINGVTGSVAGGTPYSVISRFSSDCDWSTSSGTLTDVTDTGCTFSAYDNQGSMTIAAYTSGANYYPGVTITLPENKAWFIQFTLNYFNATSQEQCAWALKDTGGTVYDAKYSQPTGTGAVKGTIVLSAQFQGSGSKTFYITMAGGNAGGKECHIANPSGFSGQTLYPLTVWIEKAGL